MEVDAPGRGGVEQVKMVAAASGSLVRGAWRRLRRRRRSAMHRRRRQRAVAVQHAQYPAEWQPIQFYIASFPVGPPDR